MSVKAVSKEIGKVILLTLAMGGLTVVFAASPGLGYLVKSLEKRRFQKYKTYRINQALKRLEKQELIFIKEREDKVEITLSDKGRQRVLGYKIDEMKLKKDRWDGWWRAVIFDIPEEKKTARDLLRQKAREMGFYLLQESVLITPWKCRDEVDFIKNFYEVGSCVTLMEVKSFDGIERVRRYFKL